MHRDLDKPDKWDHKNLTRLNKAKAQVLHLARDNPRVLDSSRPLLLARCPLFLQPPACRACKPQQGLFLPAEASLDVSNPSRFLTPVDFTGEKHMAG
ncbi:hypothetical protein HGM15179_014427 [Zosterops borbonicus]|uniref:Uncharacterized protein n=1 Tax=Zosterops borbonicus TaxID=364589 RepID=A0A8K1G6U9_9PASS|nr:hypothetical protein HGM15179_014427 [Zosterops borbonicus]